MDKTAHFDFTIENISPEDAEVLMDFIDLYASTHGSERGGGFLMVDKDGEVTNVQDA